MAKYIRFPFGVSGNRSAVPDDSQPGGGLSWTDGYGPKYELDPETDPDALLIDRQQDNQYMFDISSGVQQYQQFGCPDFITTADNGGTAFSYSQFAHVRYDDGGGFKVYESLVNTNTALPTDGTKWAQVPSPGGAGVPTGTVLEWGGSTVPDGGYVFAYGQALSRTTYSALFSRYGTAFGIGDGSTTFNMPDRRGNGALGRDDMGGVAANRITNAGCGIVGTQLGATGGNQLMQQHTHSVTDPGHNHFTTFGQALPNSGGSNGLTPFTGTNITSSTSQTGISIQNTGGGTTGSQNVQPSIIMNFIIKT